MSRRCSRCPRCASLARAELAVPVSSRPAHQVRAWHAVATAAIILGVGWLALASLVSPLRVTCDPVLGAGACAESVTAALTRGLERPHGLLLAAHVVPGEDAGPGELGHRATVTFDVLGAPAPVGVALHLDLGGHWGGVVDRPGLEVVAVPVVQSSLIVVLGFGLAWLVRSAGRGRARRRDDERGGASWNERT